MASARADDGLELHWDAVGEGPAVLLVPYWSMHPSVFEPICRELERDHRVVRYDARGCGRSERRGPYDLETGAADLARVCEAAGVEHGAALCLTDGVNRAVRIAAHRPDLIERVVSVGTGPVHRSTFAGSDSLLASDAVVDAFVRMLETDYRGALRSIMQSTNEQMSDDEVRERVSAQAIYVPQETAVAMVAAWARDEAGAEHGRALGDRLTVLVGRQELAGPWFPAPKQLERVLRESFPAARLERVSDGIVSAPEQAGAVLRAATAAARQDSPA